jgi:predicted MPP superfamily phosphohydrolase
MALRSAATMLDTAQERGSASDLRKAPRRYSAARTALAGALEAVARLSGGRARYRRRYLRRGRFAARLEEIAVPGLPRGLHGLRCAHLSDLHGGAYLGPGGLSDVVESVNAHRPDFVFLTGDLISREWTDALELLDDLSRLQPRVAALGVFGNHDYHGRNEGRIAQAYAERGLRFLRNECARFELGGAALAVVGLEDLEEARSVDLERARAGVRPGDLELVLCHNPLGALRLARSGCAAVFSGHTHGGQLSQPLIWRHGPAHPGLRIQLGATTLIVSRGLGTVALPLRLGAPADFVVATLVAAEA